LSCLPFLVVLPSERTSTQLYPACTLRRKRSLKGAGRAGWSVMRVRVRSQRSTPFPPRIHCISEASQGLPQLRGRMGGYFFPFSIIRYFYGNGRSLFARQALCAALVLLFAAVVSLLLLRSLEEFCLAGQLHAQPPHDSSLLVVELLPQARLRNRYVVEVQIQL